MLALTDSQWIDVAPFVIAFAVLVVTVNVGLIVVAVWRAYRPAKPRRGRTA